MAKKRGWLFFLVGLLLIGAYWYSIRPLGLGRAYTEDWCGVDEMRQMMAENLTKNGTPTFTTEQYAAPFGTSIAYMSWGIEMSWLGAWVWKLSRDFPFQWAYFALSLLVSYLGVGLILRKMRLSAAAAWGLATVVVLFHVPRHFKIWHHFEHLLEHWLYLSLFLDAWIWQRFLREKKWSLQLEAWRGFLLLGMLGTAGYFWGPLIMEWLILRAFMLVTVRSRWRKQGLVIEVDRDLRKTLLPIVLGVIFLAIDLRWFLPLKKEAESLGQVVQSLGWFTPFPYLLRPLWLDAAFEWSKGIFGHSKSLHPFTGFETIVTIGWFMWIPVIIALNRIRRKSGGVGFQLVLPFVIMVGVGMLYITLDPPIAQLLLQRVVPFMSFFRVANRWGLLFPPLLGVILALCWPELSQWVKQTFRKHPRRAFGAMAVFLTLSLLEVSVMLRPVTTMPPLSASAAQLLENVRKAPGTSVLDLPFCHAGGNGVCTGQQCPNYPASTAGACFRLWHDKSVYGIYEARLVESQCAPYQQAPFLSWFNAWGQQRCFTAPEWLDFCRYLDQHDELSAVLLYPDIWTGAGSPACLAQFEEHLGKPIEEASFVVAAIRGDEAQRFTRLLRFGTKCLK